MSAVADVRGGLGRTGRAQGKMEVLGAWFQAEYPSLLRFAYFVAGDAADAQDLVQEAFVKIWRAGARADEPGFRSYARKTILNVNRKRFRRGRTERAAAVATRAAPIVEGPDLGGRDEMWNAILTLSARQRACIALRFYEDMSEREVAEALGTSVGSVKKHTDRAMQKLRELLGDGRTA